MADLLLFALQIVIWYFFQICSGMSHIHECGIVHRYMVCYNNFFIVIVEYATKCNYFKTIIAMTGK